MNVGLVYWLGSLLPFLHLSRTRGPVVGQFHTQIIANNRIQPDEGAA